MTETRIPTPKRACPFTFQLGRAKETEPGKPGPLIVNAAPCIGAQCQQWLHDAEGPEFGNCALAITGIFTASLARRIFLRYSSGPVTNSSGSGKYVRASAKLSVPCSK